MTVKELIEELKKYNPFSEVLFSSDEELNTIRTKGEVAELETEDLMDTIKKVVIYGLDGSEIGE